MRRALLTALLALAVLLAGVVASAQAIGITHTCTPGPCGSWQRTPVTLAWTASDGTLGCAATEQITTDGVTTHPCTATDGEGGTASQTVTIKVDLTPPVVTGASPSRLPDHAGWYRAPVQVTFAGTDATSGLAGCTSVTYGGPDGDPATVAGTCTDVAGNVSAASVFPLRYDATAPALAAPAARGGDRIVRLRWHRPADAVSLSVVRTPGRHGAASTVVGRGAGTRLLDRQVRNGHRYRYTLVATDAAGNAARSSVSARPGLRLLAPAGGARLTAPPRLRWTAVRGARYYNVQLFRGAHKVLSAWPRRAHLSLRRSWRFAGHRQRLRRGTYAWYVWPGRGHPSERRYGALIGRARFLMAP